jgi:NADH:ubiquinone oxidoreductase subunit F (NADH-binding)/NADH:ubiquinone oxidoreductase subunit E
VLIDDLKDIQSEAGFLPRERLAELSRRESVPLYQIEAVASFYPHFRSTPPPAAEIGLCTDMSCYLAGVGPLEAEIREELASLAASGTAAVEMVNGNVHGLDGKPSPQVSGSVPGGAPRVEFRRMSCLGLCDRAPACALGDRLEGGVTIERIREFVARRLEAGQASSSGNGRPAPAPVAGAPGAATHVAAAAGDGRADESGEGGGPRGDGAEGAGASLAAEDAPRIDPYPAGESYGVLRRLLETRDRDSVIPALKESGLRGLGGAGFPTGTKWDITRKAAGTPKYVVCNADESEPGTFKDRDVLERFPHLVLEGMLIGAWVVGASRATLYLRHEYHDARERVEKAIADLARHGLAGENILGSGFSCEVELFVSPGGYICGEETALLEALEGKRAEPRNKPPFPGVVGLHGKPTLMNNVETFAMIPAILTRGARWFKDLGENGGSGLKYFALSGHVNRPGVYEAWLGVPTRRFIEEQGRGMAGGRSLKAFAPGGASSGFLPASLADLPLDFKPLADAGSMLGTGAVVAVAEGTCMLALALNVIRFFRNESCGKCVPCREGTEELVRILERIRTGRGVTRDLELIDELSDTMAMTSICGLGQAAPLPITSVVRHWRDEVDAHILRKTCPEGVCS